MKYTKTKCLSVFCLLMVVLYGMGLLSVLIQNEGRKLNNTKIKDYGLELMNEIDTKDDYVRNEMIDYHFDKVMIVLLTLYGLVLNICYNQGKRIKFLVEWFMLLIVLYMLRTWAMVTLFPTPEGSECKEMYKFERDWGVFLEAIKVYIYRNRVCYGVVFDIDLINTTVLGLMVGRYFSYRGIRLVYLGLWLLNIFTILMMRVSYTMNLYLSVVVPCLLFVIFHYETRYNVGIFGVMMKEEMLELGEESTGVNAEDVENPDSIEMMDKMVQEVLEDNKDMDSNVEVSIVDDDEEVELR